MPETTTNYGLKKPLPNEHYDIAVQNENMDTIDAVLAGKLDKTGAGSDVTVEFIQASSRANIASGEKLSILFGKLRKWFADLKTVAWTGSYSDLTDKPAIPAALADLTEDSTHRTVTDAEKADWNAKSNLALGETATTAYRGDRGKIAYDHSQTTGNPHSTTPADIGAAATVHTHSNLSVNGKALTGAVTLSASDVGAAAASHAHGNISSDGKIGSTANRAIYTGTNGVLQAGTLPISAGGTGATSADSALTALGGVKKVLFTTVNLTTSWTEATGYKYQNVTMPEVQSTDCVFIDVSLSSDPTAAATQLDAYGLISRVVVNNGSLQFQCYGNTPAVALNITVAVYR